MLRSGENQAWVRPIVSTSTALEGGCERGPEGVDGGVGSTTSGHDVRRSWPAFCPSAAQQKILTDEFHILLVRTYAKALTEYKNQTIDFKPFSMKA